ncbi:thioredoxin, mitochondrial-like isoform X2 [Chrysoperla carnea]|nr:thioredoxin, mitochondrial-like isoform X2 [Chrysoperla carnea]
MLRTNQLTGIIRKLPINNTIRCMSSNSFTVQDPSDFEKRVNKSNVPVIVDFFAKWCAPCRALAPRLESVMAEKGDLIKLAKVDIDDNADLALNYKVGSIPVLVAIRNGKVEERLEGLQDADKIRKFVDKILENNKEKESKK